MVHTGCLCKKHSPLIVWAIVWLSIPWYTWKHPTVSHTLSGFGRESPAGHPKKTVCRRHFYVSCFCSLESWLLCKLFCNVRNLSYFSKTSHLEFYFQKRLHTFKCCQCNYTPLSCLLPAHPLLHFQAVHSCVMTDLDFKDFCLQIYNKYIQCDVDTCLIREMLKGQISFENIVPGPAKVPPIKMSSVFGPRGKQSAICKKILQNPLVFWTKK